MGSWSCSIFGSDFTQDLKTEFAAIFAAHDDETALSLLTAYEQQVEPDDRRDYLYALALYLWKHGRLTEDIRNRALDQIARDDLLPYREGGQRVLRQREKVLSDLAETIRAPQPPRGPIRAPLLRKPFFAVGDVIAFRLLRSGTYALCQLVKAEVCFQSKIEPALVATYPHFALLRYERETLPTSDEIASLSAARYSYRYCEYDLDGKIPRAIEKDEVRNYYFFCEWNLRPFTRRSYRNLGNFPLLVPHLSYGNDLDFYNQWKDADEESMEQCVRAELTVQSHWEKATNEHALFWLSSHDERLAAVRHDFFEKKTSQALPQGMSFAEYAKSLGYWNNAIP